MSIFLINTSFPIPKTSLRILFGRYKGFDPAAMPQTPFKPCFYASAMPRYT